MATHFTNCFLLDLVIRVSLPFTFINHQTDPIAYLLLEVIAKGSQEARSQP